MGGGRGARRGENRRHGGGPRRVPTASSFPVRAARELSARTEALAASPCFPKPVGIAPARPASERPPGLRVRAVPRRSRGTSTELTPRRRPFPRPAARGPRPPRRATPSASRISNSRPSPTPVKSDVGTRCGTSPSFARGRRWASRCGASPTARAPPSPPGSTPCLLPAARTAKTRRGRSGCWAARPTRRGGSGSTYFRHPSAFGRARRSDCGARSRRPGSDFLWARGTARYRLRRRTRRRPRHWGRGSSGGTSR